mmetsp:Transcript_89087/g.260382  ORF Transcript_89087/g.260382 Transcript_89087/m.260382 type:complete len:201 (+) Transcript_89087:463-1065(+)
MRKTPLHWIRIFRVSLQISRIAGFWDKVEAGVVWMCVSKCSPERYILCHAILLEGGGNRAGHATRDPVLGLAVAVRGEALGPGGVHDEAHDVHAEGVARGPLHDARRVQAHGPGLVVEHDKGGRPAPPLQRQDALRQRRDGHRPRERGGRQRGEALLHEAPADLVAGPGARDLAPRPQPLLEGGIVNMQVRAELTPVRGR